MKWVLSLLCFLIFFTSALLTLNDYGISWDEPTHFKRGQGYLWYLLTGDNDYGKLPPYDLLRAQNNLSYHARSIYQDDKHNAAFYRTIDGTHPPLADILASATNMIFYQKLGWTGDVEGYHLFEIFVAGIGVAVLFLFVYESFGLTAASFSTILFATYPLFWAESHFNIKDPVETTWIILTLYFLWKAIKSKTVLYIFLSSVFAGFALSTKFNVIFLPFIILPWFLFVYQKRREELAGFVKSRKFILSVIFYPLIMFFIFYVSYPFLWENPVANIGKVLTYYQRNALDPAFANAVLPSWPFYALRWMMLTAPPLVLLGMSLSIIALKNLLFKHYGFVLLVLLWFVVPIARVSIPGMNIYGGVRQIMEYIPAMVILAGVGIAHALLIIKSQVPNLKQYLNQKYKIKNILNFKNYNFEFVCILVLGIWSLIPIIHLHPNENVYFNFLAGGLAGAVESGVPAAGNSFGNAYYQGLQWINENAVSDTKLTIIQGSSINIPRYKLRSDIDLSGDYFSGIGRDGEYIMALTFNWEHRENFYSWEYVDKFLEPVYEIKADNVPILKVWKNDLEHTKPEYKFSEKVLDGEISMSINENKITKNEITLEMEKEFLLSRMSIVYNFSDGCSLPNVSTVHTSLNGEYWLKESDPLTFLQVGKRVSSFKPAWDNSAVETVPSDNSMVFYFAARPAKFIRLVLDNEKSCVLNESVVDVRVLVPSGKKDEN